MRTRITTYKPPLDVTQFPRGIALTARGKPRGGGTKSCGPRRLVYNYLLAKKW